MNCTFYIVYKVEADWVFAIIPIIPFGIGDRVFSHEIVMISAKKEFLSFSHFSIWYITGNTLHWKMKIYHQSNFTLFMCVFACGFFVFVVRLSRFIFREKNGCHIILRTLLSIVKPMVELLDQSPWPTSF